MANFRMSGGTRWCATLNARRRAAGGAVRARYYDGIGHGTLIAAMAWPRRSLAPLLDEVAGVRNALPGQAAP
jgi:hypothetical protein